MTQEQKLQAFALYIGDGTNEILVDGKVNLLTGVSVFYQTIMGAKSVESVDEFYIDIGNCKLQLFDLSDITDEDAIAVAKYLGFIIYEGIEPSFIAGWVKEMKVYMTADRHINYRYKAADKLRELAYNLPYLGMDLVKEGIAVIKKREI